ncbi:MAG: integrase domain-containing protein [Candidatus Thiodiazotropha endolucinida]|nr:integrase domain-containing protein [Candidatus Thiodiazotropha taylori]MCW4349686.1 integrase domain-containing protein [Candidatus Thiodiazotropha endolucinida]
MRDLNYQLKQLCHRNRDGSYATQAKRMHHLMQIADQLYDLGFRGMQPRSLKQKHVEALVKEWLRQELAAGTIKNRMAVLRWWAEKADRRGAVAKSNAYYGIPDRQFVTNTSKARTVTAQQLDRISDPHVRMSLELQRAFGLRREEAIKFIPSFADRGDHITLKSTWTKGGKGRDVPVRTDVQRELLKRAHQLAGRESLIPQDRNYVQQLRVYERQTANAGLSKLHGLRHAYAQARYEELTGWKAPAAGGPITKALSPGQKVMDRQARRIVSRELGHIREQITSVYLSR